MAKKSRYPLNALDSLIPDHDRMTRDISPALDFLSQHQDLINQITRNPVLDACRQHDETLRQLTSNPVADALRRQDEWTRQLSQNPILEAFQKQDSVLKPVAEARAALVTFQLHGGLVDAAHQIADQASAWRDLGDRVASQFRSLIPDTAFAEANRVAEAFRLASPDLGALQSVFVTANFDATLSAALEQFRQRAELIASDPEADAEDVEELVIEATAAAASAPAENQAATNVYVRILLWWLLSVLAEDPVKSAAHKTLATLLIFFQTLQPVALPDPPASPALFAPAPPADPDGLAASTVPGAWQIEGLPAIIKRAGPQASLRTLEFFTTHIRNQNTRAAYANALMRFFNWCDDRSLELGDITALVVAAYIEGLGRDASAATVKQHLAAIRMLFDWLVVGQVLPMNPASSVRGPKHIVKRGAAPALTVDQARALLESIDTSDIAGLRDRAVIGVMVYTFARVSAAAEMRVEDYFASGKGRWFRLHGKGGKLHNVPAHHKAEAYIDAYLSAGAIGDDPKGPLFRTVGRDRALTGTAMHRVDVLRMIKRRAVAAGLPASICCHTFRATGITAYLENGGTIEKAQQIAGHETPWTTRLYNSTSDELTPEEIERIAI